jgi:crotonobetainyl-CoA:carnitine CoA-transferase CaiB-like acyl-CoA transferase
MEMLTAKGIPCARINDLADLKTDPHLTAVGFFQQRNHPDVGPYFAIKPPVHFSATPAGIRSDAPRLGQHTDEILAELGLL